MSHDLEFNTETSLQRFDAWWEGELVDRPPVRCRIKPLRPAPTPPAPADLRARWLSPEYAVGVGLADLRARDWLADTVPLYMPNVGPDVCGTLYGCDLEFGPDTSWSTHPIQSEADYLRLAEQPPNFANPYWQAIEQMTRLALAHTKGMSHLVGLTDLHGSGDTLVSLRGPDNVCLDLMDFPDSVHRLLKVLAAANRAAFERAWALLRQGGQDISTTWTAFAHRGPAYVSSCDFLALISPAMAWEFVRPYLRQEWAMLQRSVFHLDGPAALRHLDWLLEEDWIQAIQWVYGAGRGPASKWLEVYRQIRAAGRSVHLLAAGPEDALNVLREIGPRGLWIDLHEYEFSSLDDAAQFLEQVQRATARYS